jgi:hypothetical protein
MRCAETAQIRHSEGDPNVPRRSPRTLLAGTVALALVTGGAGCGLVSGRTAGDAAPAASGTATNGPAMVASAPAATPESAEGPESTVTPVTAKELTGHWDSPQYGDAYVQVDGAEVRIAYSHDDGRVLATLHGVVITGWWTEAPSRQPKNDAGDVQFTVVRSGATLTLHGRWRFGASEEFWYDWDLSKVDGTIPDDVRSTFADRSQFLRHP